MPGGIRLPTKDTKGLEVFGTEMADSIKTGRVSSECSLSRLSSWPMIPAAAQGANHSCGKKSERSSNTQQDRTGEASSGLSAFFLSRTATRYAAATINRKYVCVI